MGAAELWTKWVEERGIVQVFGPLGVRDMFGGEYVCVYAGTAGKMVHEEGMPFENVLVGFDDIGRTMCFINSLDEWLAGRQVVVWRTLPMPSFWSEEGKGQCSQMTARLMAYTKEEWDRLTEREASGALVGSGAASA